MRLSNRSFRTTGGSDGAAIGYANQLKAKGVTIVAVALGAANTNMALLTQLTSASNILQLSNSNQLSTRGTNWLNAKICK